MDHISPSSKVVEIAKPTPVLNTFDFRFAFGGTSGSEIPLNAKGHPYCFEFVALPGMQFIVEEEIVGSSNNQIYRVYSSFYSPHPLYIDARFLIEAQSVKKVQSKSHEQILNEMQALLGTPYVWGGNWHKGIPEMLEYYPPRTPISKATQIHWTLSGVDCSGLLYEITNGATPRNTSELIYFGNPVLIANLSLDQLITVLKPLDMILYFGHVLFVLNGSWVIESKYPFGVIRRNLEERLLEIMKDRKGLNFWSTDLDLHQQFVVRRLP